MDSGKSHWGVTMALVWKDAYRVGHEAVDEDHQYLFAIANEFCAAANATAAKTALARLLDYADGHFSREEAILNGFGGKAKAAYFHHQSHEVLSTRLRQLILRFGGGALDKSADQFVRDTAALLEMWIFNHVVKEDIHIKSMIASRLGKVAAPH